MGYLRVLPRDAFNEAKLIKCLGQLALLIHEGKDGGRLTIDYPLPRVGFLIEQDPSSGAIYCTNFYLYPMGGKEPLDLESPLNSREPYPLHFSRGPTTGSVFNDDGTFSAEFVDWLVANVPVKHQGG